MNHGFHVRCVPIIIVCIMAPLLFPGTGCGGETVRGSGTVRTETRDVQDFIRVESAGSADVRIERGVKEALSVDADDNILPFIETTIKDGTLRLTTRSNVSISPTKPIVFRITARQLDAVAMSGSGKLQATDVEARAFSIAISGSGKVAVSGKVESVKITLRGSGAIDAGKLSASSAEAVITGSGNVSVNVRDRLDAQVLGSGSIEYLGNPQVTQHVAGSGRIRRTAAK